MATPLDKANIKIEKLESYINILESRIDYLESMMAVIDQTSTQEGIKSLVNSAIVNPMVESIKKFKEQL